MAISKLKNTRIRGIVTAVPGEPIAVTDLPVAFPREEIEKIAKSVGLERLYRAAKSQTAADLSLRAGEALLQKLGWGPESIEAIINVTQTADHFSPATACILHSKLKLPSSCLAFDVNIACSGYVYGLLLACHLVSCGTAKRVVLLVGDTLGKTVSPGDRSTAVLFGDASSATAIEFEKGAPESIFVTGTDGTGWADLIIPAGAWRQPLDEAAAAPSVDENGNLRAPRHTYMDGLAVFNFTLRRVPTLIKDVLEAADWTSENVETFYFHQANAFILKTLAAKMKIDPSKVPVNIQKYGNTSLASIPLLLTDDMSRRLLNGGPHKVVMAGFGAGFSWAGMAGVLEGVSVADQVQVMAEERDVQPS